MSIFVLHNQPFIQDLYRPIRLLITIKLRKENQKYNVIYLAFRVNKPYIEFHVFFYDFLY